MVAMELFNALAEEVEEVVVEVVEGVQTLPTLLGVVVSVVLPKVVAEEQDFVESLIEWENHSDLNLE